MFKQLFHDCKTELKNVHLKATAARFVVLAALEKTSKPLDIVSVTAYLGKQQIKADQTTIFRIMHAFADKGLIVPIQFNEGEFRYVYI